VWNRQRKQLLLKSINCSPFLGGAEREDPRALGPHICPFVSSATEGPHNSKEKLQFNLLRAFRHLRRFCVSFYGRAISYYKNLITGGKIGGRRIRG